jgi:ParB family transcriptional regulator, chromosome partitioning protein
MNVEAVPIDSVSTDPANLRKHDERNIQAIIASLRRFGQQHPIVIDSRGIVLAGNGRYEAIKRMGWKTILAVRSDLAGVDATAYAIADNRTSELANWDDTALAETLRALQSEEFDIEAAGFTDDEVDQLIEKLAADIVPDFQPGTIDDQGRLDEKAKVICPECHHEFTP